MVTWIVVGALVLGVLILALAVRPVLVRLARLRRAMLVLLRRQAEAEALAAAADRLNERVLAMQEQAETAQRTLAAVRAHRQLT